MTQEWINEKRKENEKHLNDLRNEMIAIFRDAGFTEEQIEIQMKQIDEETDLGFDSPRMFTCFELIPVLKQSGTDLVKYMKILSKCNFSELVRAKRYYPEDYADSEMISFTGDIIITDPCYIRLYGDGDEDWSELGFTKYMERDTIYGDWDCTTFDRNTKEKLGEFCADSGMVGVFLLDEVLKYNPGVLDTLPEYCRTIIRDFDGDVQFKVSEERWTVNEDTPYVEKGQVMLNYAVTVEGDGVNMRTGAPIVFVGTQTGL